MAEQNDDLHQVQKYRKLVLLYEALNSQIDALLMQHGGVTENMPPESIAQYRKLARQRDDVQNEMRELEQILLANDDDFEDE